MDKQNCCGENITVLGTVIAIQIFQCLSIEEAGILAALLTTIGDQLTLLSAVKEKCSKKE